MTSHLVKDAREWAPAVGLFDSSEDPLPECGQRDCHLTAEVGRMVVACGHTVGPPLPLSTRVYRGCCRRYLYACRGHADAWDRADRDHNDARLPGLEVGRAGDALRSYRWILVEDPDAGDLP